ncbi:Opioid growth factor receptor-like protein 1 [Geodia barretti]|uniref:Opioid growth factor receptor-like protein 1 n=1 Tax=Geodia barretti TaxID=519541 RepID=A0AA35XAI1_GEOBA|nr:Opioid growth factor receptor-like protein 1 [Geodia barretti]
MKRVRRAKSKSASRSPGESRTFAKPEEAHDRGGRGKVKSRRNPPIAHPPQTTQSAEQFRLPSHGPGRKNDHALKDTSSPCHSEGHSDYSSGERHYQPSSPHYDDHHRAAKGPKPRVSCPSNSQHAASSRHVSRQSLSPERRPYSTTSQDYGRGITGAMGRLAIAGSKHRSLPALPFHRRRFVLPKRAAQCPPSIADYRDGYPDIKDDKSKNANYEFYIGKIPFHRKGVLIDTILANWWGRYDILEERHDYIQWLFPTQDGSDFNYYAQPLQKHEKKAICADSEASGRVVFCYKMMLDFYGMKLFPSGEVERSECYLERFAALNTSSHNHRRITRILKSLGELDHEYLKPHFFEVCPKRSNSVRTP